MAASRQQPENTRRRGMGEVRPFSKYVILAGEGAAEKEIGVTTRVVESGKTVGWTATNLAKVTSPVMVSHKEAVQFLVDDGSAPQAPEATTPKSGSGVPEKGTATAPDGTCSRVNGHGTPCQTKAGAGTDHKGEGACKSHEGYPLFELTDQTKAA